MLARRAAEEQLEFLIESSPAAVLTMTAGGEILLANPAAHRLFGVPEGRLPGRRIARYVPALGSVPSIGRNRQDFSHRDADARAAGERRSVPGRRVLLHLHHGRRVRVWRRCWWMLRNICGSARRPACSSLLAGSRILVAAVSHEVRNVCGAIGMMHENLARKGALRGNRISRRWGRWWKRCPRSRRSN